MSALDYAKEVYAACATIGFAQESAAFLKALIDQQVAARDVAESDLIRAAETAHRAAAEWAGRR